MHHGTINASRGKKWRVWMIILRAGWPELFQPSSWVVGQSWPYQKKPHAFMHNHLYLTFRLISQPHLGESLVTSELLLDSLGLSYPLPPWMFIRLPKLSFSKFQSPPFSPSKSFTPLIFVSALKDITVFQALPFIRNTFQIPNSPYHSSDLLLPSCMPSGEHAMHIQLVFDLHCIINPASRSHQHISQQAI
jgi:hypothetical protein